MGSQAAELIAFEQCGWTSDAIYVVF